MIIKILFTIITLNLVSASLSINVQQASYPEHSNIISKQEINIKQGLQGENKQQIRQKIDQSDVKGDFKQEWISNYEGIKLEALQESRQNDFNQIAWQVSKMDNAGQTIQQVSKQIIKQKAPLVR
jgi:hypothetical protein